MSSLRFSHKLFNAAHGAIRAVTLCPASTQPIHECAAWTRTALRLTCAGLVSLASAGQAAERCPASPDWVPEVQRPVAPDTVEALLKFKRHEKFTFRKDPRVHLAFIELSQPMGQKISFAKVKGRQDADLIRELTASGKELGLRAYVGAAVSRSSNALIVRSEWKNDEKHDVDFNIFADTTYMAHLSAPGAAQAIVPSAQLFALQCVLGK